MQPTSRAQWTILSKSSEINLTFSYTSGKHDFGKYNIVCAYHYITGWLESTEMQIRSLLQCTQKIFFTEKQG